MVQVKKRKNIIKLKRNNKKEEEKDTKLSMSTSHVTKDLLNIMQLYHID